MTGAVKAAIGAAIMLTLVPCALGVLAIAALKQADAGRVCAPPAVTPSVGAGNVGPWTPDQVGNAVTIVAVGARMGVPRYGWIIAVATAMQESSLRNLGDLGERNDHDSLGLFQQRPSQGWGTPEQVLDPVYAATMFYEHLLRVPGWQNLPLTQAAQRVQRSAYPEAYARWQPDAERLVDGISARLGIAPGCAAVPGSWVLPLPAGSYTISSPFGPRGDRFHYGQDFAAPTGTPIFAAAAGVVVDAGCTSPRCDIPGNLRMPGCGLRVNLVHTGRVLTRYCHAVRLNVHTGQNVSAGQIIGWVGSTGHSSGPHLHMEIYRDAPPTAPSKALNPMGFLRSAGLQP